jgi:hypothetical protein
MTNVRITLGRALGVFCASMVCFGLMWNLAPPTSSRIAILAGSAVVLFVGVMWRWRSVAGVRVSEPSQQSTRRRMARSSRTKPATNRHRRRRNVIGTRRRPSSRTFGDLERSHALFDTPLYVNSPARKFPQNERHSRNIH